MTVTTQTQEGKTVVKTTNSPVLAAETGVFDVIFSQYEKVIQAAVFLESPNTTDRKYTTTRALSGNTVAVTIKKTTPSDESPPSNPVWVNAETDNVAGEDVVVVADCI